MFVHRSLKANDICNERMFKHFFFFALLWSDSGIIAALKVIGNYMHQMLYIEKLVFYHRLDFCAFYGCRNK